MQYRSWSSGNPPPTIPNPGPVLGFFYATRSDVETEDTTTVTEDATTEVADATVDTSTEVDTTDESDPRVKRANAQAAKYRTDLRAAQDSLAEQGKTLAALAAVFNPDSRETDPAAQLANITTEAEGLRSTVTQLQAELMVFTLAGEHNANPTALLDSRTFANTLHGLDPTADDYRDQVANAIKTAVAANATLQTAGQGPSRGGAAGAGQGAAQPAGAVTQEQFDAMAYPARSELFRTNPDLYRRLAGTAT